MFERQGKVGYALRCGVLLLCLGFVSGQALAQEHLHVEPDGGTACLVCASGDTTPLGELSLKPVSPSFEYTETTHSAGLRAPVKQDAAPYTSRAPPSNS